MDVSIFGTMTSEVEAEHLDVVATFYPSCENATAVTDILQFNFSEFDYPGGGGPWSPPLGLISAMKITFCVINMIVSIVDTWKSCCHHCCLSQPCSQIDHQFLFGKFLFSF